MAPLCYGLTEALASSLGFFLSLRRSKAVSNLIGLYARCRVSNAGCPRPKAAGLQPAGPRGGCSHTQDYDERGPPGQYPREGQLSSSDSPFRPSRLRLAKPDTPEPEPIIA